MAIIFNRSSNFSDSSNPLWAASAISSYTVIIVPSTGLGKDFRVFLAAILNDSANAEIVKELLTSYEDSNPWKNWDKITPEFPLASISDDCLKWLRRDFISTKESKSVSIFFIVNNIFVPVSPSGTGKTFKLLIFSLYKFKLKINALIAWVISLEEISLFKFIENYFRL